MAESLLDWIDEPGPTAADALLRAARCEEDADDMQREAARVERKGRHEYAEILRHLAAHMRGQAPMWRRVARQRAEEAA